MHRTPTGTDNRGQAMGRRIVGLSLLAAVISTALIGCASGKKQYELGIQMKAQDRYRAAITAMEQALAAEPENDAYRQGLVDAKNALVGEWVAQADEILQRLRKSIAVFDFDPASNAPDAGAIFACNLRTFLFKNAGKDIKILDSENLKAIIDEVNFGRIGTVSAKTAEEIGRAHGIDVAVTGNVLRYHVDSTSYFDTKTVVYPVKKTEENIDYLNWKARHPSPTKEQLDRAPVPFIHKIIDMEKQYSVSSHKKVAFVSVSFRIADVHTGEIVLMDTIERRKTATDDTRAGIQVAGIEYDPLEIPTDTELLQELGGEVVAELGREALRPLQALEKKYFDLVEKHLQRRDAVTAAEYFVDAIFDEKVKEVAGSHLSREAGRQLEEIFRNFKTTSEN